MRDRPLRIGALISGGGRTLLNIADAIDAGRLEAEIAVVISSRDDASGVERARKRGLDVRIAERHAFVDEAAMHDTITRWLVENEVELVCACGFMRMFRLDAPFEGRAMNIHPALLPAFGGKGMYGDRVHRAVLEAGSVQSGCTVHFIDDVYDHGPVILQRTCPVLPQDDVESLAARVFKEECRTYPDAIRLFAEGRLRIEGDGEAARVRISPPSSPAGAE